MHWTDEAFVLSSRKFGETSAVARLFTRAHGVYGGVVRGAHSKSNRGVVVPGNLVSASWNARLSEQLGTFKAELLKPNVAHIMRDAASLSALSSACALLESALPERHPYSVLYDELSAFISLLAEGGEWHAAYVQLELDILAETGFGLDLGSCAATGQTHDLIYVSPKSGRAVGADAGKPYAERLLALPAFLLPGGKKNETNDAETLAGLRLTGYFLGHWLLEPHGKKLPAARARLAQLMKEKHGETEDTAA